MSRETVAAELRPQIQQLWQAIDEHKQVVSDMRKSIARARELREQLKQLKTDLSKLRRSTPQRD